MTHLAFRCFFSFHLFLQSLKLPWSFGDGKGVLVIQGGLFFCTFLMFSQKTFRFSCSIIFLYKLFWVWLKFPFTANHYYFELFVAAFLFLFPGEELGEAEKSDGTALRLIQVSILSLYFYGGLHKLVHGLWINGEFLLQEFLEKNNGGLGWTLNHFISFIDKTPLLAPLTFSQGMEVTAFQVSGLSFGLLKILSWLTILTEMLIPLLFCFEKTRRVGISLMILIQVIIGLASWETEFMFLALGSMFLFFNEKMTKRSYMLLAFLHGLWSFLIIYVFDLRVGIL
jgi:hypothetical protein